MSHNVTALVPYITEHTTALFTAGAGQSLVIKGFGLGLDTRVEIPAALGVETARAFTKTGATAGVLTITLTVAAMPDPALNRNVSISMGGVPCQGVGVTAGTIAVLHGFTPEILVKSASDGWFNADGIGGSSTPTNGADVSEWTVNGTTSGLSKFYNGESVRQPHYVSSHSGWSSGATGNHPGLTKGNSGGVYSNLYTSADGSWDKANESDWTMAFVMSPTDNGSWLRAMVRWASTTATQDSSYLDSLNVGGWPNNPDKIQMRVRGGAGQTRTYTPSTPLSGTVRVLLRRDGNSADLFYNSTSSVFSPALGSDSTRDSVRGIIYADNGVLAEVLFLKYAATDEEVVNLMSYWAGKYGS